MKGNKRICICCGKSYEYCPNCSKGKTPWKINFDTEMCKEVFNAVSAYNMNLINEDGVLKIIDKYNIVDFSSFVDSVAKVLRKAKGISSGIKGIKSEEPIKEEPIKEEITKEEPTIINPVKEGKTEEVNKSFEVKEDKERKNNDSYVPKRRMRFTNNN